MMGFITEDRSRYRKKSKNNLVLGIALVDDAEKPNKNWLALGDHLPLTVPEDEERDGSSRSHPTMVCGPPTNYKWCFDSIYSGYKLSYPFIRPFTGAPYSTPFINIGPASCSYLYISSVLLYHGHINPERSDVAPCHQSPRYLWRRWAQDRFENRHSLPNVNLNQNSYHGVSRWFKKSWPFTSNFLEVTS